MKKASNVTVMFADFVGSTRLYDRFGDENANAVIDNVIGIMSSTVCEHKGKVIKTIGDELMCSFDQANNAVSAARQIQAIVDELPTIEGFRIAIRIGMHSGEILLTKEGDLYGDTVNVAARISHLARARQIFVSDSVVGQLNEDMRARSRIFDVLSVKGKADKLTVHQIIWEDDNVTMMSSKMDLLPVEVSSTLTISYNATEISITDQLPCIMIGREAQCDLVIDSSYVSRFHVRIEFRRGRYVLVDQSTNGTFIRVDGDQDIYLRGEEMTLLGSGIISIGKVIDTDDATHLVHYRMID